MPKKMTGPSSCEGGMQHYKGFETVRHKPKGTTKVMDMHKEDVIEPKNEASALRKAGKK